MSKDSKEYERVREEITSYIFKHFGGRGICPQHTNVYRLVDSILSIEGLAILADDQTLPENPFAKIADTGDMHAQSRCSGYYCAQIDMGTAGFKKVIGAEGQ